MHIKKIARGAVVAAIASGLIVAGSTLPAQAAATTTPGFRGEWYPISWETGAPLPIDSTFGWDDTIQISPTSAGSKFDDTDPAERFPYSNATLNGQPHTSGVVTFISPRGQEHNLSAWNAFAPLGLLQPVGTWIPNISPSSLVVLGTGNPAGTNAVRAAGGEYSLGLAYTQNNITRISIDGVFFQHVTITAGSGDWKIDPVQAPAGHTWGTAYGTWDPTLFNGAGGFVAPVAEGPDTAATAKIEAEVAESVVEDGELELVAPFTAPITLGDAALNADNQSVSKGSLGQVTVKDARALSRKGWTLTSTVEDFTLKGGADKIAKSAFGVKPTIVSGATGATAGAEQVAGSAVYGSTFAERAAGTFGDTVMNADLRFLAPEFATAGTYESTLTLTLVSK